MRKPVDFAVASVAPMISIKNGVCSDATIMLGAVAPTPIRAAGAEKAIIGKAIDARTASEAAVTGAKPLSLNAYKIEITKTLVKQALQGTTSATP